jgi:hypothetical protein
MIFSASIAVCAVSTVEKAVALISYTRTAHPSIQATKDPVLSFSSPRIGTEAATVCSSIESGAEFFTS